MNDEIKDMMTTALSGDLQAAQTKFNAIVDEKIGERIELEKIEVAGRLYNSNSAEAAE